MKKIIAIAILATSFVSAQVGIGTTTPHASAQLDVTSTSKGLLPPRLTNVQKTAIASPAAGLFIWCIDCGTNGEMQVFNGTTWTNISGTTASFARPGAPTSPVATAGFKEATVTFTPPTSTGGSAITSYTVTSTPGDFTATGASSPLIVTGLTNGTSYTFTVVATNAVGNSLASAASTAVMPNCGAKISSSVYKTFACHNLGVVDTTLDPDTPVQAIHGNYYQWGKNTVAATASTAAAAITGWNTSPAANDAWSDASKTANDPCPAGFRVPTKEQWDNAMNNSTITKTGTWINNSTNYATAMHFGPSSTTKTLTLPASGARSVSNGTLNYRGSAGLYWSSTQNSITTTAWRLRFDQAGHITGEGERNLGISVRCVSE